MATTTRQPHQRASETPVEPAERLSELLALAPAEVERRAAAIIPRLGRATLAELTPSAARLIDLLDDEAFARAEPALREAVVQAVLRLGYPWALQLPPDDLALLRHEATGQRATWLRRALVVGLAVAALAAGGLSWALFGATPQAPPVPQRLYLVPSIDQVLPVSQRAQLAVDLMDKLSQRGKEDAALRVGLDCLADPDLSPSTCLTGLARTLDSRARRQGGFEELRLSNAFSTVQWTLKDPANPPPATLALLSELARQVDDDTPALKPRSPAWEAAELRAGKAHAAIERGDAPAAIAESERCLQAMPDFLQCHLTRFVAFDMLEAWVPSELRKGHREAMEDERRELARLLLKARRLECATRPPPKPLGCRLAPGGQ